MNVGLIMESIPFIDLFSVLKLITMCGLSDSVVFDSLQPRGLQPARILCLQNSPDKNTGVGHHALLQRIFPTQGSNPSLLHCRQILYCLSPQGSLYHNDSYENFPFDF